MQDKATQRAVLALVLDAHPKSPHDPGPRQINAGNAVEVAVRELVGVGLLECGGVSVSPSAAALRFYRLDCRERRQNVRHQT